MAKLLVDEAIPEEKKSNEIDGVAFQLRKGDGISNSNETECSRSNKSEPMRISKITICHCVNTHRQRGGRE